MSYKEYAIDGIPCQYREIRSKEHLGFGSAALREIIPASKKPTVFQRAKRFAAGYQRSQ